MSVPASGFAPLLRLRAVFTAEEPICLPDYAGSLWRGALGLSLRRASCATGQPTCPGCLLIERCVYSTFFETPPGRDEAARGFSAVPHPWVLAVDSAGARALAAGAALAVGFTLMGPAIDQAPFLIHALEQVGRRGLGRTRGRCTLVRVLAETSPGGGDWRPVYAAAAGGYCVLDNGPPQIPEAASAVRLRLLTPLRLKRAGRLVGPREFTAADLLHPLGTRLHRLAMLYGGSPEWPDPARTRQAIEQTAMTDAVLRWHDWTRRSARQRASMRFGGLLGGLTLAGAGLETLWPLLWMGQWTHAGKGTAFGLGQYRLETAAGGAR